MHSLLPLARGLNHPVIGPPRASRPIVEADASPGIASEMVLPIVVYCCLFRRQHWWPRQFLLHLEHIRPSRLLQLLLLLRRLPGCAWVSEVIPQGRRSYRTRRIQAATPCSAQARARRSWDCHRKQVLGSSNTPGRRSGARVDRATVLELAAAPTWINATANHHRQSYSHHPVYRPSQLPLPLPFLSRRRSTHAAASSSRRPVCVLLPRTIDGPASYSPARNPPP